MNPAADPNGTAVSERNPNPRLLAQLCQFNNRPERAAPLDFGLAAERWQRARRQASDDRPGIVECLDGAVLDRARRALPEQELQSGLERGEDDDPEPGQIERSDPSA